MRSYTRPLSLSLSLLLACGPGGSGDAGTDPKTTGSTDEPATTTLASAVTDDTGTGDPFAQCEPPAPFNGQLFDESLGALVDLPMFDVLCDATVDPNVATAQIALKCVDAMQLPHSVTLKLDLDTPDLDVLAGHPQVRLHGRVTGLSDFPNVYLTLRATDDDTLLLLAVRSSEGLGGFDALWSPLGIEQTERLCPNEGACGEYYRAAFDVEYAGETLRVFDHGAVGFADGAHVAVGFAEQSIDGNECTSETGLYLRLVFVQTAG